MTKKCSTVQKLPLLALAILSLEGGMAYGAGFGLEDGSVRGNVIPGQLMTRGDVPSAIFFNPAAITDLSGTQMEIGFTSIKPYADVTGINPYDGSYSRGYGRSSVWTLPSFYVTSQLSDSLWFGLGGFSRFGLGSEFDHTWAGRYNSIKAKIVTFDVNPNLAWKVNDRLSVALGFSIRYFEIELGQMIDAAGIAGLRQYNNPAYSPFDVRQQLKGDDIVPTVDFGLTYRLTDDLTFGFAYHSRCHLKVKGDAKWIVPAPVKALAPMFFQNTDLHANAVLPDRFETGLAWDATEQLTLSAGLTYTLWNLYDNLAIHLDDPMLPGMDTLESRKGWNDTVRVSVGAEYDLNEAWSVRAGYTFDKSPINSQYVDYLVPGDDRHLLAAGVSWSKESWTIDLSCFYEIIEDFTVKARPANGVLKGSFTGAKAYAVGLSVAKSF